MLSCISIKNGLSAPLSFAIYHHPRLTETWGNRGNASVKTSGTPRRQTDEQLLASLGYKQEFKRAFTPLEVFGIAFSIIGLLPSIASVLFYALPNGGGPAMGGGGSSPHVRRLYFWTYCLCSPRWRRLLCWLVGYANTIGSIAAVASIDWACAVQIMAAANFGSNGAFEATAAQSFGVYAAVVTLHIAVCCLGTAVLARLQTVYVVINVLLCLAVIIALPAVTPAESRNTARFALWDFTNFNGWPNGYAFIVSFTAPLWTICSFDSCVHISEEASNAAIAVPWAIVLATLLRASWVGQSTSWTKATLVIWAFVVIVQFMMGSSMLLAASRQTFAFSRDSVSHTVSLSATLLSPQLYHVALPFSGWLYRMNSYTGTPVNTVILDGILALLLGLLVFAGDQAINAVFGISIVGLYIAYAIPISARLMGTNTFEPGPFSSEYSACQSE
ncbi:putative apc amino acid permease [Lyophyllum shimeji]|uniref:Apc amino acid permease n=1 Tax=Lyophyllum shimeji TaxID=47721 RepID=A0A9P3PX48_LYOSH|nr:putative apc amino acid permease [Lyophyllum shimeji]